MGVRKRVAVRTRRVGRPSIYGERLTRQIGVRLNRQHFVAVRDFCEAREYNACTFMRETALLAAGQKRLCRGMANLASTSVGLPSLVPARYVMPVWLTDVQHDALHAYARKRGAAVSQCIRDAVLEAVGYRESDSTRVESPAAVPRAG